MIRRPTKCGAFAGICRGSPMGRVVLVEANGSFNFVWLFFNMLFVKCKYYAILSVQTICDGNGNGSYVYVCVWSVYGFVYLVIGRLS